jgi:hypothetical protein
MDAKDPARFPHDVDRHVDPRRAGALIRGPPKDLRVLRLVPEIGLRMTRSRSLGKYVSKSRRSQSK